MPVTPTYPGVYIEELPSSSHTITPAPTSLAVFVGYTHPFRTNSFGTAVRLFSFADYEREFGGFFASPLFDGDPNFSSVAHAVYQFFLNGGSDCYVVGLRAKPGGNIITEPTGGPPLGGLTRNVTVGANSDTQQLDDVTNMQVGDTLHFDGPDQSCSIVSILAANKVKVDSVVDTRTGALTVTWTPNLKLLGLQPTDDASRPIKVTVSNLQKTISANDTADILITYGSVVEVYRGVNLTCKNDSDAIKKANFINNRIHNVSKLVKMVTDTSKEPVDPAGTAFVATATPVQLSQSPASGTPVFDAANYLDVFATDSDLDKVPVFNLMVLPGIVDSGVLSAAISFCERKMAFCILDPQKTNKPTDVGSYLDTNVPKSANAALYYPWVKSSDPSTGDSVEVPPSGTVAGIYARTDSKRGVWKAPAGLESTLLNVTGVIDDGRMNDLRQGVLNQLGVDCLRTFPNIGTVVYGARTVVSANTAYEQWKYVPVRRMALFLEQTLLRNLTWAVFEPNDKPLWDALRISIENFMLGLFHQKAFQGTSPSQAFKVICDSTTTSQTDIDRGIVNILVMFAPLKPAEFVIVQIAQIAGQAQS